LNDVIVSVRMPKGLSTALKNLAETNHFMDVSEAVRSILRAQYLDKAKEEISIENDEILKKLKAVMGETK